MSKEAKILVIRDEFFDDTTIGKLYINGEEFCLTLEDAVRPFGIKVKGATAIPVGIYKVKLSMSSRFKRMMPMIYTENNGYELINGGVSFKGIRMHGGNSHLSTEGCVIVAKNRPTKKTIQGTMEKELVKELEKYDKITLQVINDTGKLQE